MHLLVMLCGYPEKIEEFVTDMKNKLYNAPEYSKRKGINFKAGAKFREIKLYDIHFLEEIETKVVSDLLTVCGQTFTPNPDTHTFKLSRFRKIMNFLARRMGYEPIPEHYKNIQPSYLDHVSNYYVMHGLMLGKMKDPFKDGIEQV